MFGSVGKSREIKPFYGCVSFSKEEYVGSYRGVGMTFLAGWSFMFQDIAQKKYSEITTAARAGSLLPPHT